MNDLPIYQPYFQKKRKKMCERKYLETTWLAGLGGWNNGGHERALLASLAEITPEGQGLNTLSTAENSHFCSQWPSLHLHSSKPTDLLLHREVSFTGFWQFSCWELAFLWNELYYELLSTIFTIITIVINNHNMNAACSFVCFFVSIYRNTYT